MRVCAGVLRENLGKWLVYNNLYYRCYNSGSLYSEETYGKSPIPSTSLPPLLKLSLLSSPVLHLSGGMSPPLTYNLAPKILLLVPPTPFNKAHCLNSLGRIFEALAKLAHTRYLKPILKEEHLWSEGREGRGI